MAKVLEKVQLKLNRSNLKIKASQHAFTENRSTVTALASITQDWFDATDQRCQGNGVHIVFVDFRKAFDLVDHGILLTKLAEMNVSRSFWKWTQSLLSNRTLQVTLPGAISKVGYVIAGVPQGGVISPTLFNVHVNDLEQCFPGDLAVDTCKYADDCTQYEIVSGPSGHMQSAMTYLEGWTEKNKMELNVKKTKEMWICFNKTCPVPPPISISGTLLERVSEFKLLGVWVQADLKWNTHVSNTIKKASKMIYHVRTCRKAHLPRDIGLTIYCSKIRPILEYATAIWGGLPKYLEEDVQKVQDRCLDIIGLPRSSLDSLAARRDSITVKEFERIVNSNVINFEVPVHNYKLRSYGKYLCRIPASYTERHKQSFFPRAARLASSVM